MYSGKKIQPINIKNERGGMDSDDDVMILIFVKIAFLYEKWTNISAICSLPICEYLLNRFLFSSRIIRIGKLIKYNL